jgi:hypothetical protein
VSELTSIHPTVCWIGPLACLAGPSNPTPLSVPLLPLITCFQMKVTTKGTGSSLPVVITPGRHPPPLRLLPYIHGQLVAILVRASSSLSLSNTS